MAQKMNARALRVCVLSIIDKRAALCGSNHVKTAEQLVRRILTYNVT